MTPADEAAYKIVSQHGSITEAAKLLGIPRTTLSTRYNKAKQEIGGANALPEISMPEFPDDDISDQELIEMRCRRFQKKADSYDTHTWFPITINGNKPIGIVWFGDPHLDDDGCNIIQLRDDAAVVASTPGLYGANIGDVTNNWAGSLARLYANQNASAKEARRLTQWFMLGSSIPWLVWIIGNHDAWGDGAEVLAQMGQRYGTKKIICHDWEARFKLIFSDCDNREFKIYASHDFPGHSDWNPLHALLKMSQKGPTADLYVAGHKHNWGTYSYENAHRGLTQHMVRVRGYKHFDEHARRNGFPEQKRGSSILTIFNPWNEDESSRIQVFTNVQEGAKYLTYLRKNLGDVAQ